MSKMNDDQNKQTDELTQQDEAEQSAGSSIEEQTSEEQVQDPAASSGQSQKLVDLEAQVQSLGDQLKRAVADYHNLEKRVAEGRSELTAWATGELIQKLLPVVDHLEKALTGMSDEDKKSGWAKGVEMSVKQFKDVLKSEGLEEIAANGQFDPTLHEAVDMRDGDDNMVLEVVSKGYKINNKVLKPAQVVVGKKGK
jgi:molecular chaperone GrpE